MRLSRLPSVLPSLTSAWLSRRRFMRSERLAIEALDNAISAYDMTYVRLARDHQISLATIDQAMRRVATRFNIPLLPA